jgi:acyl-CoA reductase-like NAD-dependent aldehyde dehydrogenase
VSYVRPARAPTTGLIAGNTQILKGADTTPLCSVALTKIVENVLNREGLPPAIASMIVGRCVARRPRVLTSHRGV